MKELLVFHQKTHLEQCTGISIFLEIPLLLWINFMILIMAEYY